MVTNFGSAKEIQLKKFRQPEHIYPLPVDTSKSILVPPVDFTPFCSLAKAPIPSQNTPLILTLPSDSGAPKPYSAGTAESAVLDPAGKVGFVVGIHDYQVLECNFFPDCALWCELPVGVDPDDTSLGIHAALMQYLTPSVLELADTPLPALARNPQAYWTLRNALDSTSENISVSKYAADFPTKQSTDDATGAAITWPVDVPRPRPANPETGIPTYEKAMERWRTYVAVPHPPFGSYYSGLEVLFDDGEDTSPPGRFKGFAKVVLMWTGYAYADNSQQLEEDWTPDLAEVNEDFAFALKSSLALTTPFDDPSAAGVNAADPDMQPFGDTGGYHFVPHMTVTSSVPTPPGGNVISKIGRYRWVGASKYVGGRGGWQDIPWNVGRWLIYVRFHEPMDSGVFHVPAVRVAAIRLRITCIDKDIEKQIGGPCGGRGKRRKPVVLDPGRSNNIGGLHFDWQTPNYDAGRGPYTRR